MNAWLLCLSTVFLPLLHARGWVDAWVAPKWLGVYVCAVVGGALLVAGRKNFRGFALQPSVKWWVVGWVVCFAASWIHHYLWGYSRVQIADWLSFGILVLVSAQSFALGELSVRRLSSALAIGVWIGLALAGVSYFRLAPQIFFTDPFYLGTWGERNLTCEYMGLGALISLYRVLSSKGSTRSWVFFGATTLVGLGWQIFLFGRAALLASAVAMMFLVVGRMSLRGLRRVAGAGVVVVITMGIGLAALRSSATDSIFSVQLWEQKERNVEARYVRYRNTLHLIADHPWFGVGPGNFEFIYPRYASAFRRDPELSDRILIRSPHNAYLELAAEFGLFGVLVLMGSVVSLIQSYRFAVRTDPDAAEDLRLLAALGLYIAVDAAFAFPLETPFLFMVSAIVLGGFLTQSHGFTFEGRKTWMRFLLLPGICWIGWTGVSLLRSQLLQAVPSYAAAKAACAVYPEDWWSCLDLSQAQTAMGLRRRARENLNRLSHRMPYNPLVLSAAMEVAQDLGDSERCLELAETWRSVMEDRKPEWLAEGELLCSGEN